MVAWLFRLERKGTYVNQFEIVAAVAAYLTFPDLLAGRFVHHFVDNNNAISSLVGGYSSAPDSCALVHAYYVAQVSLRQRTWFSFVYSEDNIADLPSRGDFRMLRSMGGTWRDCVLPTLASLVAY